MTVLLRFLEDRRRSLVGWSLGIGAYVLFNNAFYPSVKKFSGIEDLIKNMPRGLRAFVGMNVNILITSPAGYQQARLFGLVLPVLLLIFAISAGAQAIGGNEEDGTLELLLSNPVRRERVLVERYAGLVGLTLALGAVATATTLAFSPPFGLMDGVSVPGLLAACAAVTFLGLLHGSIAFAAGAVTGRRTSAIAAGAVIAVAGNLVNTLASSTDVLHAARFVTPWHWYLARNMLAQGIAVDALVLPVGASLVFAGVAYWVFLRRDLR
jgi:ABC-2 type transport system permease protein